MSTAYEVIQSFTAVMVQVHTLREYGFSIVTYRIVPFEEFWHLSPLIHAKEVLSRAESRILNAILPHSLSAGSPLLVESPVLITQGGPYHPCQVSLLRLIFGDLVF